MSDKSSTVLSREERAVTRDALGALSRALVEQRGEAGELLGKARRCLTAHEVAVDTAVAGRDAAKEDVGFREDRVKAIEARMADAEAAYRSVTGGEEVPDDGV